MHTSFRYTIGLTSLLLLLFRPLSAQQTPPPDTTGLAVAYTAFQQAYLSGNFARLDSIAPDLLPRLAASAGPASDRYVDALDIRAQTLTARGQFSTALGLLQILSDDLATVGREDDPRYLRTMSYRGYCQCKVADVQTGLALAQRAVTQSRPRAELPELEFLRQLYYLIDCQTAANQTGASLQTAQELENRARVAGDSIYLQRAIRSIGTAYSFLGRQAKALEYQRAGIELLRAQAGETHPEYIEAFYGFAKDQLYLGDPAAAEADILVAAQLIQDHLAPDHLAQAYAEYALGELYYHQNRFERAYQHQLRSIALMDALGTSGSVNHAIFEDRLAGTLLRMGRVADALAISRRVDRTVRGHTGLANASYGGSALSMMMTHEMASDPDSAFHYLQLYTLSSRTRWINEVQRFSFEDQEAEAEALTRTAEVAMSFAFRHPEVPGAIEHALDQLLLRKGLSLVTQKRMQDSWRTAGDTTLTATYTSLLAARKQLQTLYQAPPHTRPSSFDSLVDHAEALERQLSIGSKQYRESFAPVTTADLRAGLAPDEAYLELHDMSVRPAGPGTMSDPKLPVRYVGYLVRATGPVVQLDFFAAEALPPARRLRAHYAYDPQAADNLYGLFTQPLLPHLDGIRTLYHAPAGRLHAINLSALPVSATTTLGDQVAVRRLTGSRSLLRTPTAESTARAVLFGDLDYDRAAPDAAIAGVAIAGRGEELADNFRGYRRDHWAALPYTRQELAAIEDMLVDAEYAVTRQSGQSGTESAFKQLAAAGNSPRLLHLATHGYFFPSPSPSDSLQSGFEATEHPLIRSGLILAGANAAWKGQPVSDDTEDGILTAYEIAQLDLSNTELVVLSACETGLGDIQNGDGIYGLQRAFKLAGVRYVLVSLWSVDDQRTAEFMTEFYRRHLTREQSIPAAYQAAQTAMRERYNTPFNPRAWAGFVLLE